MCNAYHIHKNTFSHRMNHGYSLEEALTTPVKSKTVTDHLGNEYQNTEDMCNAYHMDPKLYRERRKKSWSIEKALTTPKKVVMDHLGNVYKNETEMCEHYGITVSMYRTRKRNGDSVKDALRTQDIISELKQYGNGQFKTIKELCAYYDISKDIVHRARKKGYDLKTAVDMAIQKKNMFKDLDGIVHTSAESVGKKYNMTGATIRRRMGNGESLTHILQNRYECTYVPPTPCACPFGIQFPNRNEMLKHYHIDEKVYKVRKKNHWSEYEALNIIPRIGKYTKNMVVDETFTISEHIENNYFLCLISNKVIVMPHDEIVQILFEKKRSDRIA